MSANQIKELQAECRTRCIATRRGLLLRQIPRAPPALASDNLSEARRELRRWEMTDPLMTTMFAAAGLVLAAVSLLWRSRARASRRKSAFDAFADCEIARARSSRFQIGLAPSRLDGSRRPLLPHHFVCLGGNNNATNQRCRTQ